VTFAIGAVVLVRKIDYGTGYVVLSWPGTLIEHSAEWIVVRAPFAPLAVEPVFVDGVPFAAGDVFTEFYPLGHWFNVFHIADAAGTPKGWYCNVTRPVELDDEGLRYVDLALDLFVHPDGRYTVLDEDEFELESQGTYAPADVAAARAGLAELIHLAQSNSLPSAVNLPARPS
jgi:protein associated with RNAse G/E